MFSKLQPYILFLPKQSKRTKLRIMLYTNKILTNLSFSLYVSFVVTAGSMQLQTQIRFRFGFQNFWHCLVTFHHLSHQNFHVFFQFLVFFTAFYQLGSEKQQARSYRHQNKKLHVFYTKIFLCFYSACYYYNCVSN